MLPAGCGRSLQGSCPTGAGGGGAGRPGGSAGRGPGRRRVAPVGRGLTPGLPRRAAGWRLRWRRPGSRAGAPRGRAGAARARGGGGRDVRAVHGRAARARLQLRAPGAPARPARDPTPGRVCLLRLHAWPCACGCSRASRRTAAEACWSCATSPYGRLWRLVCAARAAARRCVHRSRADCCAAPKVAHTPCCARQTCTACGASVQQCPFCRAEIRTRITLFT